MLGAAVGRTKMTISQFEQGKTTPPRGDLLEKIIDALGTSDKEAKTLRFLAAAQRRAIPEDIYEYFFSSPVIYSTIKMAKETGADEATWAKFLSSMEDNNAASK